MCSHSGLHWTPRAESLCPVLDLTYIMDEALGIRSLVFLSQLWTLFYSMFLTMMSTFSSLRRRRRFETCAQ